MANDKKTPPAPPESGEYFVSLPPHINPINNTALPSIPNGASPRQPDMPPASPDRPDFDLPPVPGPGNLFDGIVPHPGLPEKTLASRPPKYRA